MREIIIMVSWVLCGLFALVGMRKADAVSSHGSVGWIKGHDAQAGLSFLAVLGGCGSAVFGILAWLEYLRNRSKNPACIRDS